jgi:hypothetical protein
MDKLQEYKKRYEALHPLPEFPGETTWVDRLRTWPEFVERGQSVADLLEKLFKSEGKGEYQEQFRSLCPPLHDLLMDAFGKQLPWNTRGKKVR